MEPTLTLKELVLPFGGTPQLSIQFGAGAHLVVGPNGVGKTSLLNCIAGTLKPKSGLILVNGSQACSQSDSIILVPGQPPPIPWIRASSLFDFVVSLYPATRKSREYEQTIIERLGIADTFGMPMSSFSAGGAKKVLLAAALVAGPRVLLFDEPTNELDSNSIRVFMEMLAEDFAHHLVLITTHHKESFVRLNPTILSLGSK